LHKYNGSIVWYKIDDKISVKIVVDNKFYKIIIENFKKLEYDIIIDSVMINDLYSFIEMDISNSSNYNIINIIFDIIRL
jgi:hypothetical protein